MNKQLKAILGIAFLAICLTACGWKPAVSAVALTAPWTALNLPVKENAVVWKSDPNEFRAVHKEDKRAILKNYTDAFKAQGWNVEKFDEAGDRLTTNWKKGAEAMQLEVYDFDNTGVVIKTGAAMDDNPYSPTKAKTLTDTKSNPVDTTTTKTGGNSPKVEKADFTVNAEEFEKEFTKKGAKEEDLKKYAGRNIAVTGRVSMIVTEKKDTTQPWVTLYAPGVLGGVSCYFDDENLEQMKLLKMDKNVKVQGFKDTFIVPEVRPTLDHCVVLEGAN